MSDATDEIERLRAALAGAVEMTERAAKEIDRLETALAGEKNLTDRAFEKMGKLENDLFAATADMAKFRQRVRDDALEEAAKFLDNKAEQWENDTCGNGAIDDAMVTAYCNGAYGVRALKSQPECETCRGDPETCASVPGLHHCEKAMRGRL